MTNKLKTALVLDDRLYKQVTGIIEEGGLKADMIRFKDFKSLKTTDLSSISLIILAFKNVIKPREALSFIKGKSDNPPLVLIYPEGELSLTEYKDLIINGAAGLVPDTNLKSLFQYIIRLQDSFVFKEDVNPLFDELLENYFDNSESLVSLINSNLKYESVNTSFSKFHNLEREELRGMSPSLLWGEETFKSEIEARLKKSLKGEVIRYKAYFGKEESGAKCYEVVYRPFKARGSDKVFTLVETRDITDVEKSLKQASESISRNYYYEKYLPIGIFECRKNGDIISANEAFYNILEIPENKRDNLNLLAFSGTDNRFFVYLDSVMQGELSTFSQIPMFTIKGSNIFTRISSHARLTPGGEIVVNATLEDNTREVLLEKKLNQTQRIETLGTLAGGIAHDFNTILTTITGYTELSMDELDSNQSVYNYMNKILHSVKRAEDIVNQMLTFSRQIEVENVPVKVEKVAEEVCNFMQSALPYNILLDCEINDIKGYANADPTQLFRVFLNIMTNSMQAMESDGGRLKLKTSYLSDGKNSFANIRIEDTGKGIDKAIIDRIYEPFFTTKDAGEGTGMGLAVVHGIITGMGGEIAVESSPGSGTIFNLRIPVYRLDEFSDISAVNKSEHGTVLYVDNNLYFSRTVSLALERLGYTVRLASGIADINSYLNRADQDNEIIFFRCCFDDDFKDELIFRIINEKKKARIVLITNRGSINYRNISKTDRKRISLLYEPVTLRDIVSSIHNRS